MPFHIAPSYWNAAVGADEVDSHTPMVPAGLKNEPLEACRFCRTLP